MSFMKIAPYYNSSMGETLYKLKSHSGDFVGKKVTKDLLNSNEFKQVIEDLTFSLRVKNIEVELNVDVKSYPMLSPSSGEKVSYAHYHSGNGGYTIKADCITLADDKTENQLNFKWLETYFLDKRPVNVVFDSEFVQNGVYDITDLSNLNLVRPNVYEFSIELITYTVNKPKLTNKVTVLQSRLKRCSKPKDKVLTLKQIKKGEYTVKKGKKKTKVKIKKSTCMKYVNQVLKNKGCYTSDKGKYTKYKKYNSYFTKYTTAGLKRYGKKWNKKGLKPKVNEKGKLSKNMWTAIKRYTEL